MNVSMNPEDAPRLRIENNQLKMQIKQITSDLQAEQGNHIPNNVLLCFKTSANICTEAC